MSSQKTATRLQTWRTLSMHPVFPIRPSCTAGIGWIRIHSCPRGSSPFQASCSFSTSRWRRCDQAHHGGSHSLECVLLCNTLYMLVFQVDFVSQRDFRSQYYFPYRNPMSCRHKTCQYSFSQKLVLCWFFQPMSHILRSIWCK